MANVSQWKQFEAEVGEALGGRRRLRTTEDYGKEASDVLFPTKLRLEYPKLNRVEVECKKRQKLNVHQLFAEAVMKYGTDILGRRKVVILAHRVPAKGKIEQRIARLRQEVNERYRPGGKLYKARIKKVKKLTERRKKQIVSAMQAQARRVIAESEAKIRARFSNQSLVTVDLATFAEMFNSWLGRKNDGRAASA